MSSAPISATIPVQWGDMDALGHVNNARFFSWFESARISFFEKVGIKAKPPMTVGPILATTTCDFLIPVVYPATVRVSVRAGKVGETSITMDYELADAADEALLYARGSSVIVMVNYATMKKVRVPDDVRAAIAAL